MDQSHRDARPVTLRHILARIGPPTLLLVALIAVWELWVRVADIDPAVAPAPSRVAAALFDTRGVLTNHIGTTLAETLIGLIVGTAVGVGTGVLLGTWWPARRTLEPLLVILQTIPPIVLAPTLVLAFGFGWTPRVIVVVLIVFFPIAIATAGALHNIDRERVDLIHSFGGSRTAVLRHVGLPGALPAVFDGLKISAAYAVAGAAIAEQIGGARGGIGLYIARSLRNSRADQVAAGVVVIAALSLVVYALVAYAAHRATPWRTTRQPEPA